jgi:antitoxin component of RelBE/YafQ-DinJ toxin-antitoxin module
MAADAFIQFRVTQDVKARLREVADREQVSTSVVARQLIETMLRSQVQTNSLSVEAIEGVTLSPTVRRARQIQAEPGEHLELENIMRADARTRDCSCGGQGADVARP